MMTLSIILVPKLVARRKSAIAVVFASWQVALKTCSEVNKKTTSTCGIPKDPGARLMRSSTSRDSGVTRPGGVGPRESAKTTPNNTHSKAMLSTKGQAVGFLAIKK